MKLPTVSLGFAQRGVPQRALPPLFAAGHGVGGLARRLTKYTLFSAI